MRYAIDTEGWQITVRLGGEAVVLESRRAFDVGLDLIRDAKRAQRLGCPVTPSFHGLPGAGDIGWAEAVCLGRALMDVGTEFLLCETETIGLADEACGEPVTVRIAH